MPRYNMNTFLALAKEHGIDVMYEPPYQSRFTGESYSAYILVDSPHGKRFKQTDLHVDGSLAVTLPNNKVDWKQTTQNLQNLIDEGFIDCDDPDCEMCNP